CMKGGLSTTCAARKSKTLTWPTCWPSLNRSAATKPPTTGCCFPEIGSLMRRPGCLAGTALFRVWSEDAVDHAQLFTQPLCSKRISNFGEIWSNAGECAIIKQIVLVRWRCRPGGAGTEGTMLRYDAVLFDVDGTLLHTRPGI